MEILLALAFGLGLFLWFLFRLMKDKKTERDYKNSDMYKKTRQDFIDKINKTKGKK